MQAPVNAGGFLEVKDTLQSSGHAAVFGTGDCISLASRPDLPKNGVYAVREGGVLFQNVLHFLREEPLVPFVPQRFCRNILNTSDGQRCTRTGRSAGKTRGARKLKDRIDREWMERFTKFAPMAMEGAEGEEAPAMRCGGCGSKIAGDVLSSALKRLDVATIREFCSVCGPARTRRCTG